MVNVAKQKENYWLLIFKIGLLGRISEISGVVENIVFEMSIN